MTLTPEHDKVEALRAANPTAGNLAFVLLDSEQWTLSNRAVTPDIDIPVQTIVADLLGINFAAYQEERRQALGLSRAEPVIAASIHEWAAAAPEPLYVADTPAAADTDAAVAGGPAPIPSFDIPSDVVEVELPAEPSTEVTDVEAALIASIAEDAAEDERADAASEGDETADEIELAPLPSIFDVPVLAPVPHLNDDGDEDTDDVADAPAPRPAIIETGTYSLLAEEPSDTPKL